MEARKKRRFQREHKQHDKRTTVNHREAVEAQTTKSLGELPEDELTELREHVASCDECRGWEQDYRLFAEAVESTVEHLPAELLARQAVEPQTLTATERADVAGHLKVCTDCRRDLALTSEALSASEDDSMAQNSSQRRTTATTVSWRLAVAASLILAIALGFRMITPQAVEDREERVLFAATLGGTQSVDSSGSITAQATKIESGSDVRFRAAESVALGEGFSIESGANFQIEIDDSLGRAQ